MKKLFFSSEDFIMSKNALSAKPGESIKTHRRGFDDRSRVSTPIIHLHSGWSSPSVSQNDIYTIKLKHYRMALPISKQTENTHFLHLSSQLPQ